MRMRAHVARIMVAGAAVLALATAGIAGAQTASAAGDSVSITTTATTAASNTLVTYTLSVGCSTNGGCDNAPVTFPTNALTGDGATTDFGSWVTNSTCATLTKTAGQVSISWPSFPTGTKTCIFTMRAPNKTTQNGAVATITPTFTTSAGSVTGTPVTLTSTAGYNAGLGQGINHSSVIAGAPLTLTFTVGCGSTTSTGDLALSALQAADVLPADFTFLSLSTAPARSNLQGTITEPTSGSSGGTISYSGDGTDCLNPSSNRIVFTVSGTASTAGVADAVGATICNSGSSASFTYSDGHQATAATPPPACATVTDVNFTSNKSFASKALGNLGQYTASDGTVISPYTFPGDWDQSGGDTSFTIGFATNPGIVNGGLGYPIQDPLPCLDTVTGVSYVSNAPGTTCANPAFVPKTITATGFAPSAADLITLRLANGTVQTVAYVAGTGWTLPNVPISEIDFPAFDEQGSNSVVGMSYVVTGYVAPSALPGRIVTNTATVSAVLTGTTTAVKTPQTRTASILVADEAQGDDSGTVAFPSVSSTQVGSTCVENVTFSNTVNSGVRNQIEITAASSQAISLDYLAPVGAGAITGTTMSFTLAGQNGHSFTVNSVVPTQTANYNGTGRTHLEWVIPAGSITIPGLYTVQQTVNTGFRVALPAGCAGVYHNTLTMGYGADLDGCIFHTASQTVLGAAPMAAPGDATLGNDGAPTQYCGYLANVNITPTGQGFGIDKTVQGDGDTAPGTVGKVSPTGGSATYTVTFSNSGGANLHDAVMYDILPAVGDTDAKSLTARGSDFAVHLTALPIVPPGMTVSYSASADPCRVEVLATNPGCTNDWTTTAPALSTIKALRFEYLGTVGVAGSAVSSITASYPVSVDPSAAVGQIAWNTVGGTARIGDSGDDTPGNDPDMPASESSSTQLSVSTNSPLITKTGSAPTFTAVGDAIGYGFDVTNNQAGTITGVGVTDAFTDAPAGATAPTVTCDSVALSGGGTAACTAASTTTLAPGDVAHFTATYHVTQDDLDHGVLKDTGTVIATTVGGGQISNTSNIVTTSGVVSRSLTLDKSADVTTVAAVGDPVNYSFLVTNTGNQTLNTLLIDDAMLTAVDCPVTTLAPAASTTCTAAYATTQGDLDAGAIENTAMADATGPAGQAVASPTSSVTVNAVQARQLTLVQTASAATVHNVGDVVMFSFHVTNDGNVTVTGIAIADTVAGSVTCPVETLAPGEDETCTVDYTVTTPDLAAGSITSTGTASGVTLAAAPVTVTSNPDTAAVAVVVDASLTLTKTADVTRVTASGQSIDYSFHIVNTGQVALTGVTAVEQTFTGTGGTPVVTCPAGAASLAAGDDVTCTASYTVADADLQLSTIGNTAVAAGVSPAGSVSSTASTADVTVDPPTAPTGPAGAVGAVLAFTGASGLGTGVATGLVLLGIGAALFITRRRRNA